MNNIKIVFLAVLACVASAIPVQARTFNDKVQNRPYADLRKWHLGFSVGLFTSDLHFTHNGLEFQPVDENGNPAGAPQLWRAEQPDYQPGFCVNGLFDLRLNNYFSLRLSPGLYFGSRNTVSYTHLTLPTTP